MRKCIVSENYNHNITNRIKWHGLLTTQICFLGLDARKFSCANISTVTVYCLLLWDVSMSILGVSGHHACDVFWEA